MMGKDKAKDKEYQDGETAASSETITSPWDAHQSNRDLSQDREAWDTTIAKTITEAVAREMAKAHVHYQALLNDRSAATIQTSKTLIHQSVYDKLEEEEKEDKYSSESIERYFTLFELLLAVEELHFAKQGSMTSREFHSHIVKIAKRCKFPNPQAQGMPIQEKRQKS